MFRYAFDKALNRSFFKSHLNLKNTHIVTHKNVITRIDRLIVKTDLDTFQSRDFVFIIFANLFSCFCNINETQNNNESFFYLVIKKVIFLFLALVVFFALNKSFYFCVLLLRLINLHSLCNFCNLIFTKLGQLTAVRSALHELLFKPSQFIRR